MLTSSPPSERQKELYQLAESQGGYFTAKQAAALGYGSNKMNLSRPGAQMDSRSTAEFIGWPSFRSLSART
jgi:hypothetical protein